MSKNVLGNTCNNMISFTNALWLATTLNSTLVVPKYMNKIFQEFDLTTLHGIFCFEANDQYKNQSKRHGGRHYYFRSISGPESFFLFKIFENPKFKHQLPVFDQKIMMEMSRHYVRVYAALWSSPLRGILPASEHLIKNHLDDSLKYTTVHKRSMEGSCYKAIAGTAVSDYSEKELPMTNSEWSKVPESNPICDMSPSFVNDTVTMHGRQENKVFISFDGRGDIRPMTDLGHVISSVLDVEDDYDKVPRKYLDAFLAIHGGLFILNPRSTFSWQIFIVREILGLQSVPVLRNTDYLVMDQEEYKREKRTGLVVSWLQIVESARLARLSLF